MIVPPEFVVPEAVSVTREVVGVLTEVAIDDAVLVWIDVVLDVDEVRLELVLDTPGKLSDVSRFSAKIGFIRLSKVVAWDKAGSQLESSLELYATY